MKNNNPIVHKKGDTLTLRFYKNAQKDSAPIARTTTGKVCFLHNKHYYVKPFEEWSCRVIIAAEKYLVVMPVELITPASGATEVKNTDVCPKKKESILNKIIKLCKKL